jgi:hypothetical protein
MPERIKTRPKKRKLRSVAMARCAPSRPRDFNFRPARPAQSLENFLDQRPQTMLPYHRQQPQRHTTRLLCPRRPLLNRRFAGIQVSREDRLAHSKTLPQLPNLLRLKERRSSKARGVEIPRRSLVDSAHLVHRLGGRMDRLKSFALKSTFGCHGKFQSNHPPELVDSFASTSAHYRSWTICEIQRVPHNGKS